MVSPASNVISRATRAAIRPIIHTHAAQVYNSKLMRQIIHRLNFVRNPSLLIPSALIGVMVLAFGLQLPRQGFTFSDDWHFIFYSLIDGPRGLPELFHYDGHPQSTWGYILGFRLLGYEPLGWHLLSLFWKTASVLMFWGVLHLVWPEKQRQTFTAALIFALHPYFTLQTFAITYFEVWYSFFLLWLSIFLTIKAVQQPQKFWLWTGLAIFAKIGHVFTSEYNWFLEVFRPLFIWLVLPASALRLEKLRRTTAIWLPYLALFLTSVLWRGFFYEPLRKSFRVAAGMFDNPLLTLLSAIRHLIPDFGLTLFASWYQTFKPEYLDFANRVNILILLISVTGALLVYFVTKYNITIVHHTDTNADWVKPFFLIGLVGLFAGFLPSYAAGYTVYLSDWPGSGRLALAAFPGAALILTALLELIVRPRARLVIIAIIVALMIGWQVRVNHEFRLVWDSQKEFHRQLTWRVPGLQPNTLLVLTNPYLPTVAPDSPAKMAIDSDLAVTLAINAMYSALPDETGRISYWFSSNPYMFLSGDKPENLPTVNEGYATLHFTGSPGQIIALYYDPRERQCLRVLGPEYANYKRIPQPIKAAALASRPDNILPDANTDFRLRDTILGAGGEKTWCYYYQKGALAAQFGDWGETIHLWNQSIREKVSPRNGYEFIPFVEAHIYTGEWQDAVELTRAAYRLTPGMDAALCPLWKDAQQNDSPSPEQEQARRQVNALLKCRP